MTVRHAFGTEASQWDASDPGKIADRRHQLPMGVDAACDANMKAVAMDESLGQGSRGLPGNKDKSEQRLPEFVLLVGDKEVEQAHFEEQMRCLRDSLRASGHAVHTAVVPGK